MALSKVQKQKIIENLKEKIQKQKAIIFVDFKGLETKDLVILRKQLKETGGELKVVKKTLLGIAAKSLGVIIKKLKGQIALVLGYQDQTSIAKILYNFSKENENLKILAGFLENQIIEKEKIIELAKIPSREELLAKLVGSIKAPMSELVNVLEGNIRNLIWALSAIKK